MDKLLVISCVSDDVMSPISMHLMNNKLDDVVAGVEKYAAGIGAEVLYLLPEGTVIDGLNANVAYSITSPTLSNSYAVAQVLTGNIPRPMIQDDFVATYNDKEVSVITPEVAYQLKNGFDSKWVSVNINGKTEIKEIKKETAVSEIADLSGAKAVLIGGLKGDFYLPEKAAGIKPMDSAVYSSVTVYSSSDCMVDVCVKLYNAIYTASCGKCVLCREGSSQFRQIITEMTTGKARSGDISLIKEVGELIQIGAYCPFGQRMPRPVISAMELFAEEFEEHIKKKSCRNGICYKSEVTYYIDPDMCTGCEECQCACPEDAIEGKDGFIHLIDQDLCEQCGKCVSACEECAIKCTDGKLPKLPKKVIKVGRW